MEDVATELGRLTEEAAARMRRLDEAAAAERRSPSAWSRKEILGHLLDSALNNHQRFVRAQLSSELAFPGYEQERWVAAQAYGDRAWERLVALWAELNLHLAHVILHIPEDRRATSCRIGDGAPVTLEFVAQDYVRHLRHHLEQIFEPEAARGQEYPPFAARRT
jgi:hypothetical protein